MKDGSGDGVFDWNVAGAALCYLAAEGIVYYLITLGLELVPPNKITVLAIGEFWKSTRKPFRRTSSSYTEPLLESSSKYVDLDLNDDVDVQAERSRVLLGSMDKAIIYWRNLRKVYPGWNYHGTKVAVHSLTFAVQEGECFGFLGTNGAGKTTTLSMLSGEVRPSDGNAFIYGKDISSNPKAAHRHVWILLPNDSCGK